MREWVCVEGRRGGSPLGGRQHSLENCPRRTGPLIIGPFPSLPFIQMSCGYEQWRPRPPAPAHNVGQQNDVVRDLKLGLEEAILSQQLVTQELELLRSSTNDQELVDHIRTLEEQLRAELTQTALCLSAPCRSA